MHKLKILAYSLHKFSPLIAIDPKIKSSYNYYGIVINLSGTERLYKNTLSISKKIYLFLTERKLKIKIGAADSFEIAWALAYFGNKQINIQTKDLKHTLKNLPIHALRIDNNCHSELYYYGIKTIAELLNFKRKDLAKRFSLSLTNSLQQLLGESQTTLNYILPKKQNSVQTKLNHPISSLAPIIKILSKLVARLHQTLVQQGLFPQSYRLILKNEQVLITSKKFSLYRTNYTDKELGQLFHLIVENLLITSEINFIKVKALQIRKLESLQNTINNSVENICINYKEFFQQVQLICGNDNVFFIEQTENYIPEKRAKFQSQEAKTLLRKFPNRLPTSLLYPPQIIHAIALLPETAPARIFWQDFEYQIIHGIGPEKISENWWETGKIEVREYFTVLTTTGLWLWVFRKTSNHNWFIHGFWS